MGQMGARGDEAGHHESNQGTGNCKIIGCEGSLKANGYCEKHRKQIIYDKDWKPDCFYWSDGEWKLRVTGHPLNPTRSQVSLNIFVRYARDGDQTNCDICGERLQTKDCQWYRKKVSTRANKTVITCRPCRRRHTEDKVEKYLPKDHIAEIRRWWECTTIGVDRGS